MANFEDNLPNGSDLANNLDSWLRGGTEEISREQEQFERRFLARYFTTFDDQTSSEDLTPEHRILKYQLQGAMFKKWVEHTRKMPAGIEDKKFEANMSIESLASTADKYLQTLREDLTLAGIDGQIEENTLSLLQTAIQVWTDVVGVTKSAADPTNPYHDKFK
ncbi:MAG: hypothetical protein ABIO02_00905 [Patescibacteria group bacterium]